MGCVEDKLALEELAGNIPKFGEALAQNDNGTNGTEPEESEYPKGSPFQLLMLTTR